MAERAPPHAVHPHVAAHQQEQLLFSLARSRWLVVMTSIATTNGTGCIQRSVALIPPFLPLRELLHATIDTMKASGVGWWGWCCLRWAAPPSKSGPMAWGGRVSAVYFYLFLF